MLYFYKIEWTQKVNIRLLFSFGNIYSIAVTKFKE